RTEHVAEQALAPQAAERNAVEHDAGRRHEPVLESGLRAEPAHGPAALLHLPGDRQPGDDVSAGAGGDDKQLLHARPPRISCLFSMSTLITIASATRFITIAEPP